MCRVPVPIDSGFLCGHTTNYVFPKDKHADIYYLLGLLNSRVVDYYFKYFNNTNHVPIGELKDIPVPKTTKKEQDVIGNLAKIMVELHQKCDSVKENSNGWKILKIEIEKTDRKIDEEIYKLYSLNQEEMKTIEGDSESLIKRSK